MYGHATSCDSIAQKVCLSLTAAASQIGVSGGDALYFNPDHAHTDITNLYNENIYFSENHNLSVTNKKLAF